MSSQPPHSASPFPHDFPLSFVAPQPCRSWQLAVNPEWGEWGWVRLGPAGSYSTDAIDHDQYGYSPYASREWRAV